MSPITFDLMTPKSNQLIGSVRDKHDPSLAVIHQSAPEITRARAIFAYMMSPVTFDLGTPNILSLMALQDTYMSQVWR